MFIKVVVTYNMQLSWCEILLPNVGVVEVFDAVVTRHDLCTEERLIQFSQSLFYCFMTFQSFSAYCLVIKTLNYLDEILTCF